ncbi:NAD(P)-dependent dehydrogenase (short-subunit alcohol dehydrogenase family) [Williamsia limnetica]|uniref:NAD(P)-dependent dehydrogenase (Short-subunit alcohol dehydrogenase family) n=1 Tax=Williamsia limnetica TaxID=882452 RepID=A0A318RM02_WILLI|nr:SDR family oxidoreductase [Williamsia limnetica]PYE17345.1 NAD(P)-dependent dehydrogenase (short-subunit alcohol dehydrogenase family) [Williamsia limnetica]
MPTLDNSVVLITGANGGLGDQFVHQALTLGARKVYAAARSPHAWDDDRIVPLRLDVTDGASITAAAQIASDVTVLINNAGIIPPTASYLELSKDDLRASMETNLFGPVLLAKAFAPALIAAPGAALIDIHSVASWNAFGGVYSASKAALWSATNSLRLELAPHDVHVVGVHMGYVDTAMAALAEGPKLKPEDLVKQVYDTVAAGGYEVLGDDLTTMVKAALSGPIETLYPDLQSTSEGARA